MIEKAIEFGKPVRIGVNWGSLDADLLARHDGRQCAKRASAEAASRDARGAHRIGHRQRAARRALGLPGERIVLSCKVSVVQDLIAVYRELARRCDYPLHLGLTEAGMGSKGIVASTAAMAVLLQEGHRRHHPRVADPRAQRRPHARGDRRAGDPAVDGPALVRAAGHRLPGLRPHHQHLLPGAGRPHRSYLRTSMPPGASAIPGSRTCTSP
jgi:hypothetical protein